MREIFLTSFDGIQYGVWRDEILAVRDIRALHRIPLSPARIAGIMIDDGCTVTLADLPACVGHEPIRGKEQGCILLKQEGDRVIGFVVGGELRTQSISPGLVFPLPDYLKSPVSDTCAVHDDIPIPVINIAVLYSGLLKSGVTPSTGLLQIPDAKPQDISVISRVRFIDTAGDLFAVSAAGIEDHAVSPGPVTPLPNTPQYVQGVTFHNGSLLPVIDLALRIKSRRVGADSPMLTAGVAGTAFGLLIDGDAGTLPADKFSIKPAPMIARNSWLKHVVVRAGELIPLIDLAIALTPDAREADNMPVWQRYAPDSGFPDLFLRHEAEVVEFSLLGERYALPKQEVEDVIAFKPCRVIPDVPPIVIGLAEHKGEILPVIDPAMMFGRRSIANPGWRMMLVNNGDFRALVVTETVFGERRLPLDMHRSVPIHLPHNLMYGCYPDESAVRIILNIEAISVHFEKSMIQTFMPALSQQMRMSPTGVVYKFPGEKAGPVEEVSKEPQTSAIATPVETTIPARAEAEPVRDAASNNEESTGQQFIATEEVDLAQKDLAAKSSQTAPEFKRQTEIADAEFVEWEETDTAAPANAPEPMDVFHAEPSSARARESLTTAEEKRAAVHEQENVPHIEDAAEKTIAPEQTTAAAGTPHFAPVRNASDRKPSAQGNKTREPAALNKLSPLEALRASTGSKTAQKVSATATAKSQPVEPIRNTASAKPGKPYRMSKEVEQLATLSGLDEHFARTRKRSITYGAIAALLITVLIYYVGNSEKPVVENSIRATEPTKIAQAQPEQARKEAEPVGTKAEQAKAKAIAEHEAKLTAGQEARTINVQTLVLSPLAKMQTEPPRPAETSRPQLELDIPKNRPTDIDVYVVREGDTLWSISERFTGSPYNYPRIAGENRIADPDLIFPEQRIRLIK